VTYSEFLITSASRAEKNSAPARARTANGGVDVVKMLYDEEGSAIGGETYIPPSVVSRGPTSIGGTPVEPIDIAEAYVDYIDVIVSTGTASFLSLDVDSPLKVNAIADNWNQGVSYLCRPMAFVSKMPGIWFSKYTQAAYFQSALVTMERFRDVMNATLSAGGTWADMSFCLCDVNI